MREKGTGYYSEGIVSPSGERNVVSHFDGSPKGKATHDNLLDVIPVKDEENV